MLQLTIAAQLLPAAILLGWLAWQPSASRVGVLVQVTALGIYVTALARVGFWGWPSVWTPWLLIGVWLAAAPLAFWRRRRAPLLPSRLGRGRGSEWFSIVVLAAVGGFYAHLLIQAQLGRAPGAPVIDLAVPFAAGTYLIGQGGSTPAINAHLQTLAPDGPYRGQSRALDIVALDHWGRRASGLQPADPAAYHIFGRTVIAPCGGRVRHAVDGLPDHVVPERDRTNLAGNHVVLDCGRADVVLAHLLSGSVQVAPGEAVRLGQPLGRIGNSGNTTEPHLHLHAQTPGTAEAPLSGEPVDITIDGRYLVRNDRLVLQ